MQIIKGISSFLQKLLNYLKGAFIFDFMAPSLLVLSINLDINLTLFRVERVGSWANCPPTSFSPITSITSTNVGTNS